MIYPMFLMFLLTFVIGTIALKARFASVKQGVVNAKYYKLMKGEDVPEIITKTTRCFNNQFEIPVLFYIACTLHISLGIESLTATISAWLFVIFRIAHAYIHLSYNHVLHRMAVFWLAFICVFILWIILVFNHLQ